MTKAAHIAAVWGAMYGLTVGVVLTVAVVVGL